MQHHYLVSREPHCSYTNAIQCEHEKPRLPAWHPDLQLRLATPQCQIIMQLGGDLVNFACQAGNAYVPMCHGIPKLFLSSPLHTWRRTPPRATTTKSKAEKRKHHPRYSGHNPDQIAKDSLQIQIQRRLKSKSGFLDSCTPSAASRVDLNFWC